MSGEITVTSPTCVQCGRLWFDPAERWRSYSTMRTRLVCDEFGEQEFGDS